MQIVEFCRRRADASEYDYPLPVATVSHVLGAAMATIAVVQRDALVPPGWPLLFGLIAALTPLASVIKPGVLVPRPLLAVIMTAATAFLLLEPADTLFDFAPLILATSTAEVAATSRLLVSVPAALGALATLSVFALVGMLDNALYSLFGVVLGWTIGYLMLTQLRLLHQEKASHATQAEQAATRERQRIAREIHDVVAHSLSVTLLHLTGARRALEEDRDIDEAVDALADAERLGRHAMADIRRTVGLLDARSPSTHPEPGIADVPDLVDAVRRAGLPTTFEMHGDLDSVTGATGLGIYRISQESLANVVKHAPGTDAHVALKIAASAITLEVCNPTPRPAADPTCTEGSGLRGMRERAALLGGDLRAGPTPNGWSVRVIVPLESGPCAGAFFRRFGRQT
ncbi:sensor histidine kinase [Rhodococcus sp. NPDC058521]|uniref:sensor histidine kinase n=1 Tax=Rhodococcus sp. NPDC058521 TaxID=3346536 RepID=UPI0036689401